MKTLSTRLGPLLVMTPDLSRAQNLYEDLLGLELVAATGDRLEFNVGVSKLHIFRCARAALPAEHGVDASSTITFEVSSINDAMCKLAKAGFLFLHESAAVNQELNLFYAAFLGHGDVIHELVELPSREPLISCVSHLKSEELMMDGNSIYREDVILWSREQAAALRSGDLTKLDIEHLADEIEDVGKSEQRELENRMSSLLAHLIKWAFQPERRGSSWHRTIRFQREGVTLRIKRTPSLKADLGDPEWWRLAWNDAVVQAEKETGLENLFPEVCPWTADQVLEPDWFPA